MAVQAGDTFLLPLNSNVTPHLWVILTDPDENGEVLGVNLTSHDVFKDTTVTLEAGDIPSSEEELSFITGESKFSPLRLWSQAFKVVLQNRKSAVRQNFSKKLELVFFLQNSPHKKRANTLKSAWVCLECSAVGDKNCMFFLLKKE